MNSSTSCSDDARPALVDLGLLARGGVDHRGVGARLLADAHEVREHGELGELLDDARAGRAAREAGRDHGLPERLEHARDVDALAARHLGLLDRAVAAAEAEVRDRERLVDRRVERDGDDHAASGSPPREPRRPLEPRRRTRASPTVPPSASEDDEQQRPRAREAVLGAHRQARLRARRPRRHGERGELALAAADVDLAELLPAADRALDVAGDAQAAAAQALAAADDEAPRRVAHHEVELGAAAVADRRAREHLVGRRSRARAGRA